MCARVLWNSQSLDEADQKAVSGAKILGASYITTTPSLDVMWFKGLLRLLMRIENRNEKRGSRSGS